MIIYSIPLIFLSCLTFLENKKSITLLNNKYLYFLTFLFLTFFIGFRNEIGCDWTAYQYKFNLIEESSIRYILKNQNIFYIDPHNALCQNDKCDSSLNGVPLYVDVSPHIAIESKLVLQDFFLSLL